jgi:bidirectional [NiFe] hydrogenase diaphorase subunit
MGLCSEGPLVRSSARDVIYTSVTPADAPAIVSGEAHRFITPEHPFFAGQRRIILANSGYTDPERISDYIAAGGYKSLLRAVTEMTPGEIVAQVRRSGLRGRGGAGYPAGLKWELVARQPSPVKYVVCNADEGDPGAFMNRSVLEGDRRACGRCAPGVYLRSGRVSAGYRPTPDCSRTGAPRRIAGRPHFRE